MTDPGTPPNVPPPTYPATYQPGPPAHAGYPPAPPAYGYGYGYGYPQPTERARSISGLGIATQVLLAVQVLAALGLLIPIFHERDLINRIRSGTGTVTLAEAQRADDTLNAASAIVTILYLATGIVWIIWFYRARKNVDAWGAAAASRLGAGWAIGGWFCPIVNLWFPYLIARGTLADTERSAANRWASPRRHPLLIVWWLSYLALVVLGVVESRLKPDTVDDLMSYTNIAIVLVVIRIVSAVLALLVVRVITGAQTARLTAAPPTPQWA